LEDENTRDEVLEIATDTMATSTTKLTHRNHFGSHYSLLSCFVKNAPRFASLRSAQCTNLFSTICSTLAVCACPDGGGGLNVLNRLAITGVMAVIDSICRRCKIVNLRSGGEAAAVETVVAAAAAAPSPPPPPIPSSPLSPSHSNSDFLNHIHEEDDEEWLSAAREKTLLILQVSE